MKKKEKKERQSDWLISIVSKLRVASKGRRGRGDEKGVSYKMVVWCRKNIYRNTHIFRFSDFESFFFSFYLFFFLRQKRRVDDGGKGKEVYNRYNCIRSLTGVSFFFSLRKNIYMSVFFVWVSICVGAWGIFQRSNVA